VNPHDRSFPSGHLKCTAAEWRQQKRQEWKAVVDAVSVFEHGAAYTPTGTDVHWIRRAVDRVWENLQGDWIAWPTRPVAVRKTRARQR